MGDDHLESPIRIPIIEEALRKAPFKVKFNEARIATKEEIRYAHSEELYDRLLASENRITSYFSPDTIANSHTFAASMTAVGGTIQAFSNITKSHSFAMLRPPGHHATTSQSMGFCFFNNIAIATEHLIRKKFSKIAIIDCDNHHGNGTQEIFFRSRDVLFCSLHANPQLSYPSTGSINEIGEGEGEGLSINIPLPFQTPDAQYLYAFDTVISPIVKEFNPDVILVSLGLDSLLDDPYGALGLTVDGFYEIGKRVGSLAKKITRNYVGVSLEGGYKYNEIGLATLRFFEGLNSPESKSIIHPEANNKVQKIIYSVRAIHRNYWYDL